MSGMSNVVRLNRLVEEMAAQTRAGAITWEPTDEPDAYLSATPQGSVSIGKTGGSAGARLMYHLALFDESGNRLDEMASLVLAGLWSLARASTGVVDPPA